MLSQVSYAMNQFVAHQQTIRASLKNIRTKEEALDELRKRRRNVGRSALDQDAELCLSDIFRDRFQGGER